MILKRCEIIVANTALFMVMLFAAPATASGPLTDFSSERFTTATVCAHCHNDLTDRTGADVSIVNDWSTSMMAFSFIDPFWQAQVASEIARAPTLKEVITEKCSRCHAPMAHTQTASDGHGNGKPDYDFVPLDNASHGAAGEGVGCTLCHQIADSPILGTAPFFSGRYAPVLSSGQIYGQYSGVLTRPMLRMTGFQPIYGKQIHQSRICGTCHNVKTPYLDRAGRLASTPSTEFPEQAVYTEWEQSAYGEKGLTPVTCQECHMPSAGGVILASRPPWLETAREQFSRHTFFGANTMIRDLILRNGLAEGTPPDTLKKNLTGVRRFLSSSATVALVDSSLKGGILTARLSVQNRTGHKLPTGFPSRRLFIHYVVSDEQGRIVFESGKSGDGSLRVMGVDADGDGRTFEPHHDVITTPEQVQVYEGIMGNTEGEVTYVVVGLPGKRYTVSAELIYQTISYRFLENLYEERREPAVAAFDSSLTYAPLRQEIITRVERIITADSR